MECAVRVRPKRSRILLLLWIGLFSTITCRDSTGPNSTPPPAAVHVSPGQDSLLVGRTLQLAATVLDARGDTLSLKPIWHVSDSTRASVSGTGLVTAITPGSFAVYAGAGSVTGGAFLDAQYAVASIELPDSVTLKRYHQTQLVPAVLSSARTPVAGQRVNWSTLDTAIVNVDTTGLLTPTALGWGRIRVATGPFADTAMIHVVPESVTTVSILGPGDGVILVGPADTVPAFLFDAAGNPVTGVPVAWLSRDTTVARVIADSAYGYYGLLTAVSHGVVWIVARSEGAVDSTFVMTDHRITDWRFDPDTIVMAVNTVQVPYAVGRDSLGVAHVYGPVTPTILDTNVLSFSTSGVYALHPGVGRITGLENGVDPVRDTATVIVKGAGLEQISWSLTDAVVNYHPFHIQVIVTDSAGGTLPPKTLVVTSSDTSVFFLADTIYAGVVHDTAVAVQARHYGAARLIARIDSVSASVGFAVTEIRPSRITLTPDSAILAIGDTLQVGSSTTAIDDNIYAYPVTWSSSQPGVATVTQKGHVTAVAGGIAFITAATGSVRGSATVVVRSPSAPLISGVTPGRLLAGSEGVIHGSGFTPDPAQNTATLGGKTIPVTAATDTTLTLALPASDAFPCDSAHAAELVLSSGGNITTTQVEFSPAVPVTADTTGPVIIGAGVAGCFELSQTTDRDLFLSVTNVDTDPSHSATALSGRAVLAGPVAPRGPPQATAAGAQYGVPDIAVAVDTLARNARRLLLVHQEGAAFRRQAGSPVARLIADRESRPTLSASTQINGVAAFRIPNVNYPDYCSRYTTIQARLAYEGAHVRIFEDLASPLAGLADSAYATVGRDFDQDMWPTLTTDFGNPLALDSLLDRSGKVSLVLSPTINQMGYSAVSTGCDFFSEEDAPSSNTGEFIFGGVPTDPGTGYGGLTADVWLWTIRSAIMHEAYYLTADAERISRGENPDEVWLTEAEADAAVELWARTHFGNGWKTHAHYANTLYCEVRPTYGPCVGKPYAMFDVFSLVYEFALNHNMRSPFGPETPTDASFTGGAWFVLRWAVDRFAGSEAGVLHELTTSPLTGVANFQSAIGHPMSEVLPAAMLAFLTSESPQPYAPKTSSWDLTDIFTGMVTDFPSQFGEIQPVYGQGEGESVQLPGGSFQFFELGPYLNQLVRVITPPASPLSSNIVVQVFALP